MAEQDAVSKGLGEQETTDGNYLLSSQIVSVVQTCLRCGAEVGRRGIHDRWHDRLDNVADFTGRSLRSVRP